MAAHCFTPAFAVYSFLGGPVLLRVLRHGFATVR
jgi:hypothetical protein